MSNVPILGKKEIKKEDTFRLLHCWVCGTLEELPPYEGPAEQDYLLAVLCEKHVFASGDPHKGNLFTKIPVKSWKDTETRKDIIRQIKQGGSKGLAEIDDTFYDSRSTFMEDAMKCYIAHNRPQENDGCSDFRIPEKRLVPNTSKDREEAGMERYLDAPGPKTYLCDFCPVAIGVARRKRKLMGLE